MAKFELKRIRVNGKETEYWDLFVCGNEFKLSELEVGDLAELINKKLSPKKKGWN